MLYHMNMKIKKLKSQLIPIVLTILTFVVLAYLYKIEIIVLNTYVPATEHISLVLRNYDILIGLTIYLKTSIDFAIYIGRLMSRFPGWKNRIMIEVGTALGNTLGTMIILVVWELFREVQILMAIMIAVASFVLIRLAQEGLEHAKFTDSKSALSTFVGRFEKFLTVINKITAPVISRVVPKLSLDSGEKSTVGYKKLLMLSFSVPFILGLDDFAGYIPLFSVINVYGFGMGVFLGHMILNVALFAAPSKTIAAVKNAYISLVGSIVFVAIAGFGFIEVLKLIGVISH